MTNQYFFLASSEYSDEIDILQKLLPDIFEQDDLIVNCAWQAAYSRNVSGCNIAPF